MVSSNQSGNAIKHKIELYSNVITEEAYSETEEQLSDIEHLAGLAQQLHKTSGKLSHAVVTFKIE